MDESNASDPNVEGSQDDPNATDGSYADPGAYTVPDGSTAQLLLTGILWRPTNARMPVSQPAPSLLKSAPKSNFRF
jgi:hypothetical protein